MESVLIVVVLLLLIVISAGGIYYLNDLKSSIRFGGDRQPVNIDSIKTELDARYQADIERLRAEARGAVADIEAELGRVREGLRTSAHEHDAQLARMRDRYAQADDVTAKSIDRSLSELKAHQELELTRLREAVGAAITAIAVRQSAPESAAVASRRADALGSLYRKLAKLETSFLSVTNPVLLPGETFNLPDDLLADTLKWENWKEVGDATFAFAEAFNQDRIYLDDTTCRELVVFVRSLREVMTAAIYPNLAVRPGVDPTEARADLRAALVQLGREIPEARERLERAFRDNG